VWRMGRTSGGRGRQLPGPEVSKLLKTSGNGRVIGDREFQPKDLGQRPEEPFGLAAGKVGDHANHQRSLNGQAGIDALTAGPSGGRSPPGFQRDFGEPEREGAPLMEVGFAFSPFPPPILRCGILVWPPIGYRIEGGSGLRARSLEDAIHRDGRICLRAHAFRPLEGPGGFRKIRPKGFVHGVLSDPAVQTRSPRTGISRSGDFQSGRPDGAAVACGDPRSSRRMVHLGASRPNYLAASARTGDPLNPIRSLDGPNPGKKPCKALVGFTICRSCRQTMPESAGKYRPNNRRNRHQNRRNPGSPSNQTLA
jgi:hypothetical protein